MMEFDLNGRRYRTSGKRSAVSGKIVDWQYYSQVKGEWRAVRNWSTIEQLTDIYDH